MAVFSTKCIECMMNPNLERGNEKRKSKNCCPQEYLFELRQDVRRHLIRPLAAD